MYFFYNNVYVFLEKSMEIPTKIMYNDFVRVLSTAVLRWHQTYKTKEVFLTMKKKMTTIAFNGTKEQKAELDALIAKYKNVEGNMMPVLQGAQDIYGYLPIEVMKMIAEGLDISVSEIYGVASFYSQFSFNPKGKVSIAVCLGTACYVKGSGKIHEKCMEITGIVAGDVSPDGIFSYDATRCIGACGLAPVMTVNGDVYGRITPADVEGIIKKYL